MNKWFKEVEHLFRNGVSEESKIFANRYAKKAIMLYNSGKCKEKQVYNSLKIDFNLTSNGLGFVCSF